MSIFFSGAVFIAGTLLGSFLNVVVLRYGTHRGSTAGRSVCPHCRYTLRWWELIPVASFFAVRGRCARCGERISWQYPLVEAAAGVLLVMLILPVPTELTGWLRVLSEVGIVASLLVLGLIDRRTFLLPDLYIIILSGFVAARLLVDQQLLTADTLGGALGGSAFLLLLWLVTRGRGIGLGDVKLLLPLGALFGVAGTVVLLFLSFCFGALVSLVLLARGSATMKTAIPFGPFLTSVALLLVLFPGIIRGMVSLLIAGR